VRAGITFRIASKSRHAPVIEGVSFRLHRNVTYNIEKRLEKLAGYLVAAVMQQDAQIFIKG